MKEELSTLSSSNLSLLSSSGPSQKIIRTILKAIPNLEGKQEICVLDSTPVCLCLCPYTMQIILHTGFQVTVANLQN